MLCSVGIAFAVIVISLSSLQKPSTKLFKTPKLRKPNPLPIKVSCPHFVYSHTISILVVTEIGDTSVRAILEELFRGLATNSISLHSLTVPFLSFALDTLVSSLAMHLTSENDMRSRYNRKKSDIERDYHRHIVALQERHLSQERKCNIGYLLLRRHEPSDRPIEYKTELEETTRQHRLAIQMLDEEIRNVQILFIQAYKK